jgi:hypothetical protein
MELDRLCLRECLHVATAVRAGNTQADFRVYWSSEPGTGKSHAINQLMTKHNPPPRRVHHYLDTTIDELPADFAHPVVHVEFSPDLFGNEFRLFDQLFLLTSYGYYLRSDSTVVSLSEVLNLPEDPADGFVPAILFEVPSLAYEGASDRRVAYLDFAAQPEDFPIPLEPSPTTLTGRSVIRSSDRADCYVRPFTSRDSPGDLLSAAFPPDRPPHLLRYLTELFAEPVPATFSELIHRSSSVFFGNQAPFDDSHSNGREYGWRRLRHAQL